MSQDIIWEFKFPSPPEELTDPPQRDEVRYQVQNQPKVYDSDQDRADLDSLTRLRERFKYNHNLLTFPGKHFDFLYSIVGYGEQIPFTVAKEFGDTVHTITQTLLGELENNPSDDWAAPLAKQYRTIVGMLMYLLTRQLKNLTSQFEINATKIDREKKTKTIQKVVGSLGSSTNIGLTQGDVSHIKWGRDFQGKLQKHILTIIESLFHLFHNPLVRTQYENEILDQDYVVNTFPSLIKLLTSTSIRLIFTHQPALIRSFTNLFICLIQTYCAPEMVDIGPGIGTRCKSMVCTGLAEMIKQDIYDYHFFVNIIIISFSKFNSALLFTFLFEIILQLPPSEKTTFGELPKLLKLLGVHLPARCLQNIQPLLDTLSSSQSYSIRNSIVELIASIVSNAFILPPEYTPTTKNMDIYYKPLEHSSHVNKPGAVKSESGQNNDHDDDDDDNNNIDDLLLDDDNDIKKDDDDDNDDGDDDDKIVKKSSKRTNTNKPKRSNRYSMGGLDESSNQITNNQEAGNESTSDTPMGRDSNGKMYKLSSLQISTESLGAAKKVRTELLGVIFERLDDVHSEARARAVVCLGSVLLTNIIPFELQFQCLRQLYNGLSDKSSKVRRFALLLYRAYIQRSISPTYPFAVARTLNETAVRDLLIVEQTKLEQCKTQIATIESQLNHHDQICTDIRTRLAPESDETRFMQQKGYAESQAQIIELNQQGVNLTLYHNDVKKVVSTLRAELHMIDIITQLLNEKCLQFLKSHTVSDIEESIACILYSFDANLENTATYITALLNECWNPSTVIISAQIWGDILLRHHEHAIEHGHQSPVFFELIKTIIRIPENAKPGLNKIFSALTSKNMNVITGATASSSPLSIFLKDMQNIDNDDALGLSVLSSSSLTAVQLEKLQERYNNLFSFLLSTSLDYLSSCYVKVELLVIDLGSIITLIRALIGANVPIAPQLFDVFWSLLISSHAHPYVTIELLQLIYNGTVIIAQDKVKELVTLCVNNVLYGLQCIVCPPIDSLIQYDTIVNLPIQVPINKVQANTNKKNSKRRDRGKGVKDEIDSGDDVKDEVVDDKDPEYEIEYKQRTVSQTVIVDEKLCERMKIQQGKLTLYWTSLAEVCIKLITKLTINPLSIYEHLFQQASTVLYELPDQIQYDWVKKHGGSYIPSLCAALSTVSRQLTFDQIEQQQKLIQSGGDTTVSLHIPQQCHCQSKIALKANEQRSVTLPPGFTLFDKQSKLAISVISQQERLSRLFTITGFIAMNILSTIEENENKIRFLCKREFEQGLYKHSVSGAVVRGIDSDSDDDDNNNDAAAFGKVGATKRRSAGQAGGKRSNLKKTRHSISLDSEDDDNIALHSDDDEENSDFDNGKKKGGKKPPAKKAPAKKQTNKKVVASVHEDPNQDEEEERAGMISRAEQHIEENIRFIERTLRNPENYLGMIYHVINNVCRSRKQFQPAIFYSALTARCRLMLVSKDLCKDAVPGIFSLLRDLSTNTRSYTQDHGIDYITTVKQIIALGIADGAQRFPNECSPLLDQLNQLAVDKNWKVGFYALHALASVLLTGMHKPNKALPYICSCLAQDNAKIVTTARALVQTLGTKRDNNVSLIATSLPDIISRFVENLRSRNKQGIEKSHKVLKELLVYVKTEQEICKVVKGITVRLTEQLKLNNLESSGRTGAAMGTGTMRFDGSGAPLMDTSTRMLLNKVANIKSFDRLRFTTGVYKLSGYPRNWKPGRSGPRRAPLKSFTIPIIAHQDLKSDVVSTTLVPTSKNTYCDCEYTNTNNCQCVPTFSIHFNFMSADEHNLLQLDRLEALADMYQIISTSDSIKMAEITQEQTKGMNPTGDTKPTSQDFFERTKFLLSILRHIKFNVTASRRFFNDFNDYSQACHHPQLFHELKLLGKHIRGCVTKRGPTGTANPDKDTAPTTTTSGRSNIEIDAQDWEDKITKEYERYYKKNSLSDSDVEDDDENGEQGQNAEQAQQPAPPEGRPRRGVTAPTQTEENSRPRRKLMNDADGDDERVIQPRSTRATASVTTTRGQKGTTKKQIVKRAPTRGRGRQEQEQDQTDEEKSSSEESSEDVDASDANDDDNAVILVDDEPKRPARATARRGRR